MNKVNFNLEFSGVVDLEGNITAGSGPSMTMDQLRDNLVNVVHLAVAEGDITHNTEGTLESHDYQVSVTPSQGSSTFSHVFVRNGRHGSIDNLAVLTLVALNKEIKTLEDALETFEYCLTSWAKTTVEGFNAYGNSARDFNIGDLLMIWPSQGLRLVLEKAGLAIHSLESVSTDQTLAFDRHLVDGDAIPRKGDELLYKPESGEEGEFVNVLQYGHPMTTVRGVDGQEFDVYPSELS